MPQSTSSRLSSPLSSQSSQQGDDASLTEDGPTQQARGRASASRSPDRQSNSSGTSVTVLLDRPGEGGDGDDESALSALSSDDDQDDHNEGSGPEEVKNKGWTWDENSKQWLSPKKYSPSRYKRSRERPQMESDESAGESDGSGANINPPANAGVNVDVKQARSESDSGSLSPPPPSSEIKPKPLPPTDDNPVKLKVETQDSDESELESLTDSNDEDRPQESNEEQEDTTGGHPTESEQAEEEDGDGDGDGDITMRAEDQSGVLEAEGEERPNGEDTQGDGLIVDESGTDVKEDSGEGEQDTNMDENPMEENPMEQEEMEEVPASPALSIQPIRPHSSHPQPPTSAAVKALFGLEIKFAALRDRLYIERMEETAAEEEMILNGTHPAVSYLFKNLRARRERLHEVASRRHKQVQEEILKVKDENKEAVWTWWTDERDREQWEEFEQTWAKRRRLIREKSELDSAPTRRLVPKTWADMPKPLDWAAGAVPASMSASDAANDLALMDLRRQQLSRHASPAVYQNPNAQAYPQYYHPDEYQHPHYAQRVPQPQAVHRPPQPQAQVGSSAQGFGPAVFQEPRREGRTVPTSSALFDSGNGRRSNDQPHIPQAPVQPQGPPPPPASLGADLWGKESRMTNGHSQESNGFGAGNGNGTGRVYRMWNNHTPMPKLETSNSNSNANPNVNVNANTNGTGGSNETGGVHPANNTDTAGHNGPSNGNGNGNQVPTATTNGQTPKDPSPPNAPTASTEEQKPTPATATRYPGLSEYLTPTPATQTQVQTPPLPQAQQPPIQPPQKVGTVSPPKSSLGISGIPSGMPFI